ncbi:hypothetical protein ACFSX9_06680 [Flavobacterium ardleyense]|uniref:DUF3592 domain containing protein n=1 Tax=Flavobacterium ardleyense TaxID=2038737 RepID=A0ABW5Z7Y5_9FLAO
MVGKILYKLFIFIISAVMFSTYLLIFYYCISNTFFTFKNWNNLEKGEIVNIRSEDFNDSSYTTTIYDVSIDSSIFRAEADLNSEYDIGAKVLVQHKGSSKVRIIYVNDIEVGSRINATEYITIFFLILMLLITYFVIRGKMQR